MEQKAPSSQVGPSELTIVYRPLRSLKRNPQNPRIHSERQVKQVARSIEAFGFNVPVLVDRNLVLVGGHGRIEGAKLAGLTEVPTIQLEHLTEAQARAFGIADNRLTENSVWNEELLAQELKFLSEIDLDFSLEATGFEIGEIDAYVQGLSPANRDEGDLADAIPTSDNLPAITKEGDLWLLGRHRVLCGNSLNESSFPLLMQNRKAAMVFVDPQYNVPIERNVSGLGKVRHRDFAMATGEMSKGEFTDFLAQAFRLLVQHSVPGSIHYACSDWRHIQEPLDAAYQVYSELKNVCIWVKNNAGMGTFYRSQHELVFVFKAGEASHRNNFQLGQFGRYRTNVWSYPGANSFSRKTEEGNLLELHPTVKPVALVADAIMDVSTRGDIVLDSFLGSGSTLIAAERTGRICCGIEIDPKYVDTIVRRWQKLAGLSATHSVSGRSFKELEEEVADAAQR